MKRPRKRFEEESQILYAIERLKARSVELVQKAEEIEEHNKQYRDKPRYAEQMAFNHDVAKKLRRKSQRLLEGKLLELKAALGEIQTTPMGFLIDGSIERPPGT